MSNTNDIINNLPLLTALLEKDAADKEMIEQRVRQELAKLRLDIFKELLGFKMLVLSQLALIKAAVVVETASAPVEGEVAAEVAVAVAATTETVEEVTNDHMDKL